MIRKDAISYVGKALDTYQDSIEYIKSGNIKCPECEAGILTDSKINNRYLVCGFCGERFDKTELSAETIYHLGDYIQKPFFEQQDAQKDNPDSTQAWVISSIDNPESFNTLQPEKLDVDVDASLGRHTHKVSDEKKDTIKYTVEALFLGKQVNNVIIDAYN